MLVIRFRSWLKHLNVNDLALIQMIKSRAPNLLSTKYYTRIVPRIIGEMSYYPDDIILRHQHYGKMQIRHSGYGA